MNTWPSTQCTISLKSEAHHCNFGKTVSKDNDTLERTLMCLAVLPGTPSKCFILVLNQVQNGWMDGRTEGRGNQQEATIRG